MNEEMKIYLSEYYDSILDDEFNAIVLAWIEQSGTTTEEELSKEIRIDEKKIKNIIVKLFKNQLIEVSKDFLKISLKGKQVIDSLNLSNELVRYLYSASKLNSKEEIFLFNSVKHYRNKYYHNYLNTCHSLKTWSRISHSNYFKNDSIQWLDEQTLFIIINDLFVVLNKEADNPSIDSFKVLLNDLNYPLETTDEHIFKSQKVFNLLREFYSIKTKDELNKYDNSKRELFEFAFCKDIFLTDEKEQTKWILELKKSKTKDLNETTFNTYYYWKDLWFKQSKINFDLAKQYQLIAGQNLTKFDKDSLETVLFLFENSESIKDLSIKLEKLESDTTEIIERLSKQIIKLTEKTTVNIGIVNNEARR